MRVCHLESNQHPIISAAEQWCGAVGALWPFPTPSTIRDGEARVPTRAVWRAALLLAARPEPLSSCSQAPSPSHSGTRCPHAGRSAAKRAAK